MSATRFLEILGAEDGALRSTDDVLAAALPLLEQVAELHERGQVAPLEGVEALFVFDGKIWFEMGQARAPRFSKTALERVEAFESDAFEVAGHRKKIVDRDGCTDVDLRIVEVGEAIVRPCYVTRYVSWEHEIGHHDPLTDIFVLGLVLASLALDQNLGDPVALRTFVEGRSQLVETTRLHPVVARAIARMTEADRRKRVQDLPALIATLKTYREQGIASEEIPLLPGDGPGKKRATYARLRDKLFDFSKRNRMLYFSPTSATVNLTLGSVPLVLDVKSIPAEALLTWKGKAAAEIASTKPVPLGRYLRFEDYPVLLASLDQLRLEANRSKTELGFSPLRLCVCFLHWHNLKEAKEVRISSPLLLLPVALEKKKGVRDAVVLTASSDQAEVNPVLRQYLAQLYVMSFYFYM